MTGGLGFIGSRLCETLLRQGREVVCVDDLRGEYATAAGPAAALRLRALGAELVLADASAAPLRGAGGVVHLAGLPGVRTRRSYAEIWAANAGLTERLVEAAGAAGARFVLGSTSSVYGNPAVLPTPEHSPARPLGAYAMTKAAGEASVRAAARAGADALTVRLFTVYGPGQRPEMAFARWIEALAGGRPVPWCAPLGAARDFTYVDDAVAGLVAALDRGQPGEAYNVSGGRSLPLAHALGLLEGLLGRRALVERSAPSGAEARVTSGCGRKAEAELGYRPRVELAEGLRLQAAAALPGPSASRRRPFAPGRARPAPSRSGSGSPVGVRAPELPRPVGPPAAATSRG